jgi:hypothetical protein
MSRLAVAVMTIVLAGSGYATSSTLPDLTESYIFSPAGKLTALRAGATYQASKLPLTFRVTPPDGGWAGAQWKANTFTSDEIEHRHLTCASSPAVCKPPYYGWVALARGAGGAAGPPRALILVMTSYSRTPSVRSAVAALHRGHGVTYEPAARVKLAGLQGVQFDGQTLGAHHLFIPFSPPSHGAAGAGAGDLIAVDGPGHPFRFVVLNVRGQTVVVFLGSLVLSPSEFATFLPDADHILATLRFPGG